MFGKVVASVANLFGGVYLDGMNRWVDSRYHPGYNIHYLHYLRQVGVAGRLHAGAEHHGGLDGAGHGHLQLHRRQLLTQVEKNIDGNINGFT